MSMIKNFQSHEEEMIERLEEDTYEQDSLDKDQQREDDINAYFENTLDEHWE